MKSEISKEFSPPPPSSRQGQLDRAREVLALHSSHLLSDDKSPMMKEALNSVDELLRKMPLFSAYVGKSVTEFDLRWQRWREECHLRLAKGELDLGWERWKSASSG